MNPSERTSKVRGFLDLLVLLFGGPFLGIAFLAVYYELPGWPAWVFFGLGTVALISAFWLGGNGFLFGILALAGFLVFKLWLRGLATLASNGAYGSGHTGTAYGQAEFYLIIAILWLLVGVPDGVFRRELDLDDEGSARKAILGLLVTAAAILTGIYILMLHFGGPLHKISLGTLVAGIIFTIFLVRPAYMALVRACWQRGVIGAISPKPLLRLWGNALTELDTVALRDYEEIQEVINKARAATKMPTLGTSDAQRSAPGQRPNSSEASPTPKNPKRAKKTAHGASYPRRPAPGQRPNSSGASPTPKNPKWTRPTRRS